MTVLASGQASGRLHTVQEEVAGENGEVIVKFASSLGAIHPTLAIGANVANARRLASNSVISAMGMILVGGGFIIEHGDPLLTAEPERIRPYLNGKDLTQRSRGVYVIDMYGLSMDEVRARHPACFQRLHDRVKPERDVSKDKSLRENWWLFRRTNIQLRQAIAGLPRYIGTTETAKHRLFSFIDGSVTPDQKIRVIGSDDAVILGTLSSSIHVDWALATGGTLEDRPVYNNTTCFETFPFPAADTGLTPALADRISSLAEQLDAHRKARQAAHESVTLTGMYNVLDKLRRSEALTVKDKAQHEHALVGVLQSLHDELDAAVLQAYGWADLGPIPWADAPARAAWTESLLERLVALNTRRAAEEAAGTVRWLRPEFQDPTRRAVAVQATLALPESVTTSIATPTIDADAPPAITAPARQPWPSDLKAQLRSVADLLSASPIALSIDQIADRYTSRGPWKKRLPDLLDTLEALARARADGDGWRAA